MARDNKRAIATVKRLLERYGDVKLTELLAQLENVRPGAPRRGPRRRSLKCLVPSSFCVRPD